MGVWFGREGVRYSACRNKGSGLVILRHKQDWRSLEGKTTPVSSVGVLSPTHVFACVKSLAYNPTHPCYASINRSITLLSFLSLLLTSCCPTSSLPKPCVGERRERGRERGRGEKGWDMRHRNLGEGRTGGGRERGGGFLNLRT